VIAQPRDKFVEAKLVRFVKRGDEGAGLRSVRRKTRAIDCEKSIGSREGRPLVPIDKRMVLREAFPQRGGFLDQVRIIPVCGR